MKIGLGLPTVFPSGQGALVMEWARRADTAGFSTLAIRDRLVYTNFESLVTLTAAAAVTERIRLMTAILIAPLRSPGVLAKQAASLDALSNGRLTLGLAVGNREDDFVAAASNFHDRGKRFESQIEMMKRIWAGGGAAEDAGPLGPAPVTPGGPQLIIGGNSSPALARVAKWADGYIIGPVTDHGRALSRLNLAREAWDAQGRTGKPRFFGSLACAIGEEAARLTAGDVDTYDSHRRVRSANAVPSSGNAIPSTAEAICERLRECEELGLDEVLVRPAGVTDPDQVDRLAEAVLR
jgi:alkanesulfonate monooxygenase SsuD/methylene tetrahydromethanopterin reductase-like flavin-dependent oxidoreductase (luciferase family)